MFQWFLGGPGQKWAWSFTWHHWGSQAPPKILVPLPPLNLGSLDIKAPRPPLIYLVGLLAILDPHINICVGPPHTCIALKRFNLLPPNTLF